MTAAQGGGSDRSAAGGALSRLVRLAQDATDGAMSPREEAGLQRFEQAIAARGAAPRTGRRRAAWVLGAASLAAGVAAAVLVARARTAQLTFDVVNGSISDGGYVRATKEGGATELRFSDGSTMVLDPATQTRVGALDAHGGRVLLESGHAHVHITPRPHARWAVDAGPYTVHVVGTEFDVRWSGADEVFDVRMQKGVVIVRGPLAAQGLTLEAGQHLVARVREHQILLDGRPAGGEEAEARPEAPSIAPPPAGAAPPVAAAAPRAAAHAPPARHSALAIAGAPTRAARVERPPVVEPEPTAVPGWGQRLAGGDFQGILSDAERLGLDRALAQASRADLQALADAARYARRSDVARRALLAERQRFPSSIEGREAAFFLGGLSEDGGPAGAQAALDWYDRYLGESGFGAYAPQALGRKMVLVHRLRGAPAARPIAADYIARFPEGPYAASARRLLNAR